MKNIFVKPNEQSKACFNSAMARKGRTKSNLFTPSLLLVAVLALSCSGMRKFDRVGRRNGGYEGMIYIESTTN